MGVTRRFFMALAGTAVAAESTAAAQPRNAGAPAGVIDSLAILLTLDPPRDGEARRVLGRGEPGDGGGGWFRWRAGAADPPDGGTVFAPSRAAEPGRAAGRWLRIVEGDWRAAWFGVRADGVADDGPALARAIDAAAGRMLVLDKGRIRIDRPLAITAPCYYLRGQQPERGQYGRNTGTVLDATRIGPGRWLVERFDAAPPLDGTIGPFVHENLDVRLGEASGFAFGRSDLDGDGTDDVVRDRVGQKYVHGVVFESCRLTGALARYASDEQGRLTRSGQRLIFLTKCFESRIENCSLVGGDVQVETWGCDAPLIRNLRSNNGHLPILLRRSGWFGVSHRVADLQCESFTFGAVVSDGVMLEASNLRIEPNVAGSPRGAGRFDLTEALGATAEVAAGEDRIRMSRDMTGVLFPGLSLIELSDAAGHRDTCLVTAVAGPVVTIWSEGFTLPWSAAAARVVRIHGYGLMHGGAHDATIVGGHPDPFRDCPTFVYRGGNGSMLVSAVGKVPGSNGDVRSLALGNLYRTPPAQRRQMSFAAVSPWIVADPAHPYVTGATPTAIADREDAARSRSPRNAAAIGVPFMVVPGPQGEAHRIPAWLLRTGATLTLAAPSTAGPGSPTVLARAVEGGATARLRIAGQADVVPFGPEWSRAGLPSRPGGTMLEFRTDHDVLIAEIAASPG